VAAIVTAHNGNVEMITDPTAGTSVRVTLPQVQPDLSPKEETRPLCGDGYLT
jgi:hypothetical protein